jgi:hypothetical protein
MGIRPVVTVLLICTYRLFTRATPGCDGRSGGSTASRGSISRTPQRNGASDGQPGAPLTFFELSAEYLWHLRGTNVIESLFAAA